MFELVTDPDLNELSIIQVCNSVEHVGGVNASLLVIDEDEELDPEYEPVPSLLVDPPDELEVFTDLTWDDVLSLDLTIPTRDMIASSSNVACPVFFFLIGNPISP